jgi:ferredoxin
MIAKLDRDGCISCGLCPTICPEVFRMDEDDIAEVIQEEVPTEAEDRAVEAQENCPVSVILVEE